MTPPTSPPPFLALMLTITIILLGFLMTVKAVPQEPGTVGGLFMLVGIVLLAYLWWLR